MEMNISQFLVWLGGAGCVIAASWILERFPKYQELGAVAKQWIFFAVAAVLGIGAYVVATYVPVNVLEAIAPYFTIIAAVFSYQFLGTAFHKVDRLDR